MAPTLYDWTVPQSLLRSTGLHLVFFPQERGSGKEVKVWEALEVWVLETSLSIGFLSTREGRLRWNHLPGLCPSERPCRGPQLWNRPLELDLEHGFI